MIFPLKIEIIMHTSVRRDGLMVGGVDFSVTREVNLEIEFLLL